MASPPAMAAASAVILNADQIHSAKSYSSDSSGSSFSSDSGDLSDARPAATNAGQGDMRQESTFTVDNDSAAAGASCATPATVYEARRLAKVRETP
ncbi:unnamed protein product [Closterium sp. Yama58-4]|nr:unnamed protein product [Closterium sp. Yama58-4]